MPMNYTSTSYEQLVNQARHVLVYNLKFVVDQK